MEQKIPNYHRQRFLLNLLKASGGTLTKIELQKLLFLSQDYTNTQYYDFVPFHFGCYSFQAQSDLELFESRGWLKIIGHEIEILEKCPTELASRENAQLEQFVSEFENFRGNTLVRYVYEKYPYYAVNSKIAESILEKKSFDAVISQRKKIRIESKGLFTIGYQGKSLEQFVNQLIVNDIRVLCDVRRNAFSRKFGFSKSTLGSILPKLGIDYVHIPELGISSQNRANLATSADYVQLFETYRKELLGKSESINTLNELFDDKKRIALTCFEEVHTSCHRHCISDYLEANKLDKAVHL